MQVNPQGISSPNISIHFSNLSDSTFGIGVKDLLDMVKNTSVFQIDNGILSYEYESKAARVMRRVELLDIDHNSDTETPLLTLKLGDPASGCGFRTLSDDDTTVTYRNGRLVLETFGHIRTRMVVSVDKVDGIDFFRVRVKGKDLRIVCEMEGERVLCYHESCLVVYGFEKDTTTAAIIGML